MRGYKTRAICTQRFQGAFVCEKQTLKLQIG